jgi:hypothetical protein
MPTLFDAVIDLESWEALKTKKSLGAVAPD